MVTKRKRIKVVNCLVLGPTDDYNQMVEFPYIKGLTFKEMYQEHFTEGRSTKVELRDARISEEYMTLDHISEAQLISIIDSAIQDNTFHSSDGGYCRETGYLYDSDNLSFHKTGSYVYGDSSEPRWHEWRDDGYTICPHCHRDSSEHTEDVCYESVLSESLEEVLNLLGYDSYDDLEDEEDLLEEVEECLADYISFALGAEDYEFIFKGFGHDSTFRLKLKGGDNYDCEPDYEED